MKKTKLIDIFPELLEITELPLTFYNTQIFTLSEYDEFGNFVISEYNMLVYVDIFKEHFEFNTSLGRQISKCF